MKIRKTCLGRGGRAFKVGAVQRMQLTRGHASKTPMARTGNVMSDLNGYTIVFDLDGTLVDTAPDLIRATDHVLAGVGLPPADSTLLRDKISFGARRMISDALASHGQVLPEATIDTLHHQFLAHYEANIAYSSRPYQDAVNTLVTLRMSGARLAVCTNKKERLARALLNALCIDAHFEGIAGIDTFAVSKPHPGHILQTVSMAGGDRARAIMVGDSENDIKAARAASIPVIGFLSGYSHIPMTDLRPDAVFSKYVELKGLIDSIVARDPS